jgi:putative membrane protein
MDRRLVFAKARYHLQFMYQQERSAMTAEGLVHSDSKFPPSLTLITAVVLLFIAIAAIVRMLFQIGPFG